MRSCRPGDDGRVVIVDTKGNRKASSSFLLQRRGSGLGARMARRSGSPPCREGLRALIYALDFSGKERLIYRSPGGLTIHDISKAGLVLLTADKSRITLSALAPGETHERSLSWFDWSSAHRSIGRRQDRSCFLKPARRPQANTAFIFARPMALRRCGWAMEASAISLRMGSGCSRWIVLPQKLCFCRPVSASPSN